jgi:murein DD-endopeptidase MepM/ murein hydrolase activator NlpD
VTDALTIHENPEGLRRPMLIMAFAGWNDAAESATGAARYLGQVWPSRPFASIDPEEFYHFGLSRPYVRYKAGSSTEREVIWPVTEFSLAQPEALDRDLIVGVAVEPHLKWRTYCGAVLELARRTGASLILTLGALLAEVPHTRPVRLSGGAQDPELAARLGIRPTRYEGPTGIVGVLNTLARDQAMPTASLWANVPHYISGIENPKASMALVRRVLSLLNTEADLSDLEGIRQAVRAEPRGDRLAEREDRRLHQEARAEEAGRGGGGSPHAGGDPRRAAPVRRPRGRDRAVPAPAAPRIYLIGFLGAAAAPAYNRSMRARSMGLVLLLALGVPPRRRGPARRPDHAYRAPPRRHRVRARHRRVRRSGGEGSIDGRPIAFFPFGEDWAAVVGIDLGTRTGKTPWRVGIIDGIGAAKASRRRRHPPAHVSGATRGPPRYMVDLEPEAEQRANAESARLRALYDAITPDRLWQGRFMRPVAVEGPGSGFGSRRVINGKPRMPHSGIDWSAERGTPVVAANRGRVVLVGDFFFAGRLVVLDHGLGLYTLYMHLDRVDVTEGVFIGRGETLGTVGATGRATGPHLHFQVQSQRDRVDPATLFAAGSGLTPRPAG